MDTLTMNNSAPVKSNKTLLIILVITTLLGIGLAAIWLLTSNKSPQSQVSPTSIPQITATNVPIINEVRNTWGFDGNNWSSAAATPECIDPLELNVPVNINLATNILYPGQVRSGDFKPHGGFRFDANSDNQVSVTLPMDAILYRGSRYIEAGEVQYLLDFITPCGLMFRYDHLLVLSERLTTLVESLPAAQVDMSQTTNFSGSDFFDSGDVIATEIGFAKSKNVAFDFGVYDLRARNTVSQDADWAAQYQNKKETAYYGVCWLNYLASPAKEIALALPGSGTEGKTSDYCK